MITKHSARVTAFQLIYADLLSSIDTESQLQIFLNTFYNDEKQEIVKEVLDYSLLIFKFAKLNTSQIKVLIQKNISEKELKFISNIELAVLILVISECNCILDLDRKIIINEGLNITRDFIGEKNVSSINYLLDKIIFKNLSNKEIVFEVVKTTTIIEETEDMTETSNARPRKLESFHGSVSNVSKKGSSSTPF